MATPVGGLMRIYNQNLFKTTLRLAQTLNKRPYTSLQERDIRASCHYRYLPTRRVSFTSLVTRVSGWFQGEKTEKIDEEPHSINFTPKDERRVLKLVGLSPRKTSSQVVSFLSSYHVSVVGGSAGVHRPKMRNGLPSNNVYVEVANEGNIFQASSKKRTKVGERYLEISRCKSEELKLVAELASHDKEKEENAAVNVLCLLQTNFCDLPELTKEDIANFFAEFEILPSEILLCNKRNPKVGSAVAAYVQFPSIEKAREALLRDKEMIRGCQVGVYRSVRSMNEVKRALNNPTQTGRFYIGVRGIPATTSEDDIVKFFTSADVKPLSVYVYQTKFNPLEVRARAFFGTRNEVFKVLDKKEKCMEDRMNRKLLYEADL